MTDQAQEQPRQWQVDAHNGNWLDEGKRLQHSEFLERMLRTVSKHDESGYQEFAVAAGDAVAVAALLNAPAQEATREVRLYKNLVRLIKESLEEDAKKECPGCRSKDPLIGIYHHAQHNGYVFRCEVSENALLRAIRGVEYAIAIGAETYR